MSVRVLVVWEPILPTDWSKPSGMVERRVSDSRVVQFWDKEHLVAKELKQQFPSSQTLGCCQHHGILWDFAAVYQPKVEWNSSPPVFFGGPVLDVADAVRQHLPTNEAR
jgi:hypothetical protein